MKNAKSIFFFSLILTITVFTQACSSITSQPAQTGLSVQFTTDTSNPDSILAATLQIIAFPAQQPDDNGQTVYERGLASLIQVESEILLVSHDHWNFLADIARVQFLDADSSLLAEISGDEFRSLIRYHDQGSLLLDTPAELDPAYLALLASRSGQPTAHPILPGRLADLQTLQVGQIVSIAYRVGENRSQVGTKQAAVVELFEVEGLPAFRLQSLDGSVIMPGDSGGGIWLDGQLVGNMWMSERIPNRGLQSLFTSQSHTYLDTSIASRIPGTLSSDNIQLSQAGSGETDSGVSRMEWDEKE